VKGRFTTKRTKDTKVGRAFLPVHERAHGEFLVFDCARLVLTRLGVEGPARAFCPAACGGKNQFAEHEGRTGIPACPRAGAWGAAVLTARARARFLPRRLRR